MCADGARDDNDEEQGGDDACDAVQNDHGHGCGRGRAQRVLLGRLAGEVVPAAGPALDVHKVLGGNRQADQGVMHFGCILLAYHGQDGEALHRLLGRVLFVVAVVGHDAVQDDARDVCILVGVGEDALGVDETRVVARVAANVGDVVVGDARDIGEVGVVQVALDLRPC